MAADEPITCHAFAEDWPRIAEIYSRHVAGGSLVIVALALIESAATPC
jgi:hypothetical protein